MLLTLYSLGRMIFEDILYRGMQRGSYAGIDFLIIVMTLGVYQVILAIVLVLQKNELKPDKALLVLYLVGVIVYFSLFLGEKPLVSNELVLAIIASIFALFITFFVEKNYVNQKKRINKLSE